MLLNFTNCRELLKSKLRFIAAQFNNQNYNSNEAERRVNMLAEV